MKRLGINISQIVSAININAIFVEGRTRYERPVALWARDGVKIYGLIPGKNGLSVADFHPDFAGYAENRR